MRGRLYARSRGRLVARERMQRGGREGYHLLRCERRDEVRPARLQGRRAVGHQTVGMGRRLDHLRREAKGGEHVGGGRRGTS